MLTLNSDRAAPMSALNSDPAARMPTLTRDRAAPPERARRRRHRAPALDALEVLAVRSAAPAIVAAWLAATALIVLIALGTTPIADDYVDLAQIGHWSTYAYLHNFWLNLTDRYCDAAFMVALIKPFGVAAVHIATPLLFAVLCWFCAVTARVVSGPRGSRRKAAMFGCVAGVAIATATPSLFDTLGWFNAVAIYLTGIVAAASAVAWMALLAAREQPVRLWQIASSFAVGVLAAGFTELVGMVIASGALLAAATARTLTAPGERRRALIRAYLALSAGAAAGVMVILFGPGSRGRLHFQHGGFDLARMVSAIGANMAWVSTFRWDALAWAAAGLLALALRPTLVSTRSARWLAIWCAFLVCVPLLAVDVSTALAGGSVAAPRTAYVAVVFIGAGVAAFVYLLAAGLFQAHPRGVRLVAPAAALAFVLAVLGLGSAALPVLRAEQLRRAAVDGRAASVRRQLALHRHYVTVAPAPLLILDTSAFDLNFRHQRQHPWVLVSVREYYRIPARTALRVISAQPRNYCIAGVSVPWSGVTSCEQLRKG